MSGAWSGGGANRMWNRGRQRDGTEDKEIRRILDAFRAANGWQPGMAWNPRRGMYERNGTQ